MRNIHIVLAFITAVCIALYAQLGLAYYFDGYGLMPTVCAAVVILVCTILAVMSYMHGYNRSYSKE